VQLPALIYSPRLRIQQLRYEEADEIFYTYASKLEATRYVLWPTHHSVNDTRQFLKRTIAAWKAGREFSYGIRTADQSRLIGSFGVVVQQQSAQFGYILSPTHWGRGFATEVCRAVLPLLTVQADITRIWTLVDCDNTASIRVLQKAGLQRERHLQQWQRFVNQDNKLKDCFIYALPANTG